MSYSQIKDAMFNHFVNLYQDKTPWNEEARYKMLENIPNLISDMDWIIILFVIHLGTFKVENMGE